MISGSGPPGRHLRVGPNDGPWATIVGVVGDVKQTSLAVSQSDAVYLPTAQWRFVDKALWLVVRAPSAAALAPAMGRPHGTGPSASLHPVDLAVPEVRPAGRKYRFLSTLLRLDNP